MVAGPSNAAGASLTVYDLFVDGAFRASSGDERIAVGLPYDDETWATVPDATVADVDDAVYRWRRRFSE